MKTLKIAILLAVVLTGSVAMAQTENVLLERSYWNDNPDLKNVKQKIAEGNDPTALTSNAFDPVVYAITAKADSEVIKYLLSLEGNPVDKKTHDSRIYLHWASYAGNTEIVNFLLDEGSPVDKLDSHGFTPLAFAANAGVKDPKIYQAFEDHGVNLLEEKNEHGANLLLLAAPSLQNEADLKFFTDKGFKLDYKDEDSNGIFNYAAKKGNIDFLKLLVEKGVDYKSLNAEGGNAFLFAVQGGRGHSNGLEVFEYLKQLGLEPNIVTEQGNSPLHRLAYGTTDPAIFEFFLAARADVNQKDDNGNTPFLNAASRNNMDIVKLLSKDVHDINTANSEGQTALMLAVQRNSPDVVAFLLESGANAQAQDSARNSLAYYLVDSYSSRNTENFSEKLQILKAENVDFQAPQAEGNTLYHLAVKKGDLQLLKYLDRFDIDLDAKNDEGLTALHLAAMKSTDDQMMKYLIDQGASTDIKTDFEESVYDLASENEILQKQNTPLNFLK